MHPDWTDFEYVQAALEQAKKLLSDAHQQLRHLHYQHDLDDAEQYDEGMAQALEGLGMVESRVGDLVEKMKADIEEPSEEESYE